MNWQFLPQVSGACEAVSGTETRPTRRNTPENPESLKPPCLVVRVLEISLMAAEKQAGHPKLSRQLDGVKITMAFDMLGEALARVDMKDRRKGLILGVLGSMAFNLIALIALFVLFALWRGWV